MIHPDIFDCLNIMMKRLRRPEFQHLPFGGLQLIICGDFFQLPPVVKQRRVEEDYTVPQSTGQLTFFNNRKGYYGSPMKGSLRKTTDQGEIPYLFDSDAWKELLENDMDTVRLSNVFRQKDPAFLEILDELRTGKCQRQTWDRLKEHRHKCWPKDGILV
jgi:ATP-dependent DNA helicase PIF1